MAKYKISTLGVLRDDGVNIPASDDNKDWREYQHWLSTGGTPDPADPEPAPPTTEDLANNWLGNPVNRAIIQGIADSAGVAIGIVIANIQQAARGN